MIDSEAVRQKYSRTKLSLILLRLRGDMNPFPKYLVNFKSPNLNQNWLHFSSCWNLGKNPPNSPKNVTKHCNVTLKWNIVIYNNPLFENTELNFLPPGETHGRVFSPKSLMGNYA